MLVSMLTLETRSSPQDAFRQCYLFTKSWSKSGFSAGRLTAVNFIWYPASSIQFRYQLRQRQTSFCHLSSVLCLLSSVLRPLSSVIRLTTSVFCHLSSDLCLLSSVFRPLSSVFTLCQGLEIGANHMLIALKTILLFP